MKVKSGVFKYLETSVCRLLVVLFISFSINGNTQDMMKGSISSLGANLLTSTNQMSQVVGDINNDFNFYSEQSFSSGSMHCFLIYNIYNDPSDEGGDGYVIFPNPTSDEIKILFHSPLESDYKIEVYDAIGKIILKTMMYKDSFGVTLDFSPFAKGMYSVYLMNINGERILEKIIKAN